MAQSLSCDREQDFLMPPSVRESLPAGHLAWYLLEVVERLDLDDFYGEYRAMQRAQRLIAEFGP
jgi:hypothetical protein